MAGSLVLIQETTVSSGISSVSLTGIDTSFNVYKLVFSGLEVDTDGTTLSIRVTTSGTADTSSNYDRADKQLISSTSFLDSSNTNQTSWAETICGTGTGEASNGVLYLFNFTNSSEFSFITRGTNTFDNNPRVISRYGGGVHTVAQTCDGIQFFVTSGNIDSANFKLYGLVK